MHQVQPDLVSSSSEDDGSKSRQVLDEELKVVTEFSWNVAINFFDKKTKDRLGKTGIYFMEDGSQIQDENYLTCVTSEICREFGFELLDAISDLILPVGFSYPSLANLQDVVDDAFKPISKMGQCKTIVWIEDENWNIPNDSIVEPLVMHLLLKQTEPFLIAPMKYFDKEVLSTVFKVLNANVDVLNESSGLESSGWKTFAALLKFGFLLTLRSSKYPVILLHFSQRLTEAIDAFEMVDLAEAEGHEVKHFKNIPLASGRGFMLQNFVEKLVSSGASTKKIRLE